MTKSAELQIIFLINENICCDPLIRMMDHKICVYGEIWLIMPGLSLQPLLIWSTEPVLWNSAIRMGFFFQNNSKTLIHLMKWA